MSLRLQALLEELRQVRGDEYVVSDYPSEQPDEVVEFNLPYEYKYLSSAYQALTSLICIRRGDGYCYFINVTPYLRCTIVLKWWGSKDHPRLHELKAKIHEVIRAVGDRFWEEYQKEKVLEMLRKQRDELTEQHRGEIDQIYEYYSRLRFFINNVYYDPENDAFVLRVAQEAVGRFIGKQGATIKPLQERLGKKIIIQGE